MVYQTLNHHVERPPTASLHFHTTTRTNHNFYHHTTTRFVGVSAYMGGVCVCVRACVDTCVYTRTWVCACLRTSSNAHEATAKIHTLHPPLPHHLQRFNDDVGAQAIFARSLVSSLASTDNVSQLGVCMCARVCVSKSLLSLSILTNYMRI